MKLPALFRRHRLAVWLALALPMSLAAASPSKHSGATRQIVLTARYMGPNAGFSIEREEGGHEMALKPYATGGYRMVGTKAPPECPAFPHEAATLIEAPGLRLSVVTVDAQQNTRWQQWLDAPVHDLHPSVTMRQWLEQSVQAMGAAWVQMAPLRGRPALMEFVLHLAPEGCSALVKGQALGAAQARQHIVFPLALSESFLQGELQRAGSLQELLTLLAHETAHLLQLYPYSLPMVNRYLSGGAYHDRGEDVHLSVHGEAGAGLVSLALMQAIFPSDRHSWWTQSLLWARAEPGIFAQRVKHPAFRTLAQWQADQPEAWEPGVPSDEALALLFAQAVMELDRDLSQPRAKPDASQLARGKAALEAVRRVVPQPFLISGPLRAKDLYSKAPLTADELRKLRTLYRP